MGKFLQPLLVLMLSFPPAHPGRLRSQIVGGHEAKAHSRPYMAALKAGGGFICGGFLVAPQWVMTAAHCFSEFTVILGAHDVYALEESQQVLGVESYHIHPEHNPEICTNDLLLLKLNVKANLNKYVQTVPLPESDSDLPGGTACSLAGWGLIDQFRDTNKLYETNVTIYDRRKCMKFHPELDDGMICAGSHNQLRDSSQGDSGGPMVCNGIVHGIVSFGYDFPPGVYTRIANYLPWIKRIMQSGL